MSQCPVVAWLARPAGGEDGDPAVTLHHANASCGSKPTDMNSQLTLSCCHQL